MRHSTVVERSVAIPKAERGAVFATVVGAPIGLLGGLIGLGGAEFRLPILRAAFHYPAHQAVALNLAVSLLRLLASLAIRLQVSNTALLEPMAIVIVGMSAASMLGAYLGAAYATRISEGVQVGRRRERSLRAKVPRPAAALFPVLGRGRSDSTAGGPASSVVPARGSARKTQEVSPWSSRRSVPAAAGLT